EAVAEQAEADTERADLVTGRDALLEARVDRAVVEQRSTGGIDEAGAVEVTGAKLGRGRATTGLRVAVARDATVVVVQRAETGGLVLVLAEALFRGLERSVGQEAVGSLETGRRLGDHVDARSAFGLGDNLDARVVGRVRLILGH